jgi:hypothetical protein
VNLRVQVLDAEAISRLTGGVDQFSPQVVKARRRTMKQLMKFAGSQVKKKLAAETWLPQKAFKGRVVVNSEPDGSEGLLWLGAYSVTPYGISPRVLQNKVGIKAGRITFAGAFKPTKDSSDKRVFIRKAHSQFNPDRYTKTAFGSGQGYPIVPVAESIEAASGEAFEISSQAIEDRFETIFRQQLTYALEVEGK